MTSFGQTPLNVQPNVLQNIFKVFEILLGSPK